MSRILMVHSALEPPGGGSAVCAWMLEALRGEHELSLLTWVRPDLDAVNSYFGTTLAPEDIAVHTTPASIRSGIARLPFSAWTLRSAVLRRSLREIAGSFDMVVSASNEADLGPCPGIQYIHYPVRGRPDPASDIRWYHSRAGLKIYEELWSLVAPFNDNHMRANITLVNSAWTGSIVRNRHSIPVRVVHPPAAGNFPAVPWSERESAFVCIGRMAPVKRLENVIEIVGSVRASWPQVQLYICGPEDDRSYARTIREHALRAGAWVHINGALAMPGFEHLLANTRYAIHGMAEEHFGIGLAQAVRAGCIPFVPDGGGQVEIVGDEPLLRYRSMDDAVKKIIRVLGEEELQQRLRSHLAQRAPLFSPDRFIRDIRCIVAEAIQAARLTA